MPLEIQDNFTQGLNDRLPPYKIPQEAVQESVNCDFSFGDVRGVAGIGTAGGGTEFYYEAGTSWVGKTGIGGQATREIKTFFPSDNGTPTNDLTANTTLGTPVRAEFGAVVSISEEPDSDGNVLTCDNTIVGLSAAQSFVEYNDDLYVSREDQQISIASISANSLEINVGTDIYKFVLGDEIKCVGVPEGAYVTDINISNSIITISEPTTTSVTDAVCIIKGVPIRFIDGDLTRVYPLGLPKPSLGITVDQIPPSQNTQRADSYSASWYSSTAVTFQYGIAAFDEATGAEGGLSDLSDATLAEAKISKTDFNLPITIEFNQKKVFPSSSITANLNADLEFKILNHPINDGDRVQLTASDATGDRLPSPLTEGTSYYAIKVDNETIKVANSFSDALDEIAIKYNGGGAPAGDISIYYGAPDDGKYAVYRTGGTSAVVNRLCNLYYKNDFRVELDLVTDSHCVDITPYNYPTGGLIKAYWYSTDGVKKYSQSHNYDTVNSDTRGVFVFDPDDGTVHLSSSSSGHKLDITFTITFPDDDREYVLTGDRGCSLNIEGTDIIYTHVIDAKKSNDIIPIQPVDGDEPIKGLRFLTEVNDFFFGAVGKRVHVSSWGRPNVWPLGGFIDFDSNITALKRRGGELIVFTEHGIYRVYGTSPDSMRKVRVPTVEGVKEGLHKCIAEIRDGLIYVSHSGISYFNGRDVEVLTQLRLGEFKLPSNTLINNVAGVVEDVYYLLGPNADGYRLDLRFGSLKLSKCTFRASNLFYRGVENKLYSEKGVIGEGDIGKYTFKTRSFTGGDITKEKLLRFFRINGFNFSGTVQLFADQELVETFVIGKVNELNRSIYTRSAIIANTFSVKFFQCEGRVQTVSMDFIPIEETPLTRYDSITFSYTGSPTVSVKVDNVGKISDSVLTDTGTGNTSTATLYFPSMTEGHIVHVSADETEENRIMSYSIVGEAI